MFKKSFSYILPTQAEILILGSLPGDLSIAKNQYYAHPKNRFWKIIYTLFDETYNSNYEERVEFLHLHKIALWDVCAFAHRPGSMDNEISNIVPNAIDSLLKQNPTIKDIFFNGQKAQKIFNIHFKELDSINCITLPSTSPANAQFSFEKLLIHWQKIKVRNT